MKNKSFLIVIITSVFLSIGYMFLKNHFGFQFPLTNLICIVFSLFGIYSMILSIKDYDVNSFVIGDILAFKRMEKIEYKDNGSYNNFYINIRFHYNNEEIIINRKTGRMTEPRIGEQIRLEINKVDIRLSEINEERKFVYFIGILIFTIAILVLTIYPFFNFK